VWKTAWNPTGINGKETPAEISLPLEAADYIITFKSFPRRERDAQNCSSTIESVQNAPARGEQLSLGG
jgi:hypothetical protein